MNDASDQPVKKEAPPLVVGGAASKPVRRKKPWRKIGIVAVVLVVLAAVGVGIWWMLDQQANYLNISNLKSTNARISQAQELAKQPVPKDPKDRATYYAMIATNLQTGKQYTYAEHFLLTAQKVVDDNNLDKKQYRYYAGLADIYRLMGNTGKAATYDQLEQKFLQSNYSKDVLDQMKGATTDARHTN